MNVAPDGQRQQRRIDHTEVLQTMHRAVLRADDRCHILPLITSDVKTRYA